MHFHSCRRLAPVLLTAATIGGCATSGTTSTPPSGPASTSADITAADLRSRLFAYADDSMMGRKAGTEGNMKATTYIANELRRLGVQPGGENGTYFQEVPILHLTLSRTKPLTVDGKQFLPTRDFLPRTPRNFDNLQAIYGGVFGQESMISTEAAAGKVVLLSVPLRADGKPDWENRRIPSTSRYRRSPAVVIIGFDGMTPRDWIPLMEEGGDVLNDPADPPDLSGVGNGQGFMYVSKAMATAMMGAPVDGMAPGTLGRTIGGRIEYDSSKAMARNVIGIIPGSDPALKGQYVALGAHNDHVGWTSVPVDHDSLKAFNIVALPHGADSLPREMTPAMQSQFRRVLDSLRKGHSPRRDSIFNGADDDGSGSVSALEIIEAFQKSSAKPKRSLIFVWHTGEELGLFGSQYFTDHPTVPRDSIVAQLNMDMIGRGAAVDVTGKTAAGVDIMGGPDYVQLVGSRRLSTELGDLTETVNKSLRRPLRFDYSIDANGHKSMIYCRSDHYSYARYGIPIVFFTTGGHSDYHQVTDEPQYIQYDHMARVAVLVRNLAERIANLDHRIVVDKPKPNPKGECVQ